MKRMGKIIRDKGILLLLAGILCVYVGAVCLINFSGRPGFYCTDMYTDIAFAAKAWEQKSLIPEGWRFGNQLYVVATPALAALFCGLAPNPVMAMALAAVTMTVLILVAFWWMLKEILPRAEEELLCMAAFMALGLYFGDSVGTVNGWQLFFTMCAYYGCYLLNVLLAFGCYLRADRKVNGRFRGVLAITCALSFGTGMQSLRQTAIMSGPLMGLAAVQLVADLWKKRNWKRRTSFVALVITLSNLAGLVYKETIELEQTEIFGQMGLADFSRMGQALKESFGTMLELLHCETAGAGIVSAAILICCTAAVAELCMGIRREENRKPLQLTALLGLSLLAIFAIDVATTLEVRSIYYFMLYLLVAVLLAVSFSHRKELGRWVILAVFVTMMVLPGMLALKDICLQAYFARYDRIHEVSDYLLENDYDTVYAPWNLGEDIAIASDCAITVGFWDEAMFLPVKYLCDPAIYEADSSRCIYALFGEESAALAEQTAADRGVELSLLQYLPESNVYLYTAPVNLMQE